MAGIVAVVLNVLLAAFVSPVEGSYVAQTLNGRALPTELRIAVDHGDVRLFKLEQGVLSLRGGGRFTLYFRYYHQLVRKGGKPLVTPVLSDSESGTYELKGNSLVLTPTKKSGSKSRPTIPAIISADEITASYVLRDAVMHERVTLVMRRDASFW
jgi:hypothetical protein